MLWAMPRLGLRWQGFRRVRGQVRKRLARRAAELHLGGADDYREWLEHHPEEWALVNEASRISVSRFGRDFDVWQRVYREALPPLLPSAGTVRIWSAGCAGGEEPYTWALIWKYEFAERFPDITPRIEATDAALHQLARARNARYARATLRELPATWVDQSFRRVGPRSLELDPSLRVDVHFRKHDLQSEQPPAGAFHLISCRNVVFTYFDLPSQRAAANKFASALTPGGLLWLGRGETLPPGTPDFEAVDGFDPAEIPLYRRCP